MRAIWLLVFGFGCTNAKDSTDSETDLVDETDTNVATFDDDLGVVCPSENVLLPDGPTPVWSFPFLPTSNGYISSQYAIDARGVPVQYADGTSGGLDQRLALVTFTDHITKNPTPDTWTRDRLWDAYPGVRIDNDNTWLGGGSAPAATSTGYEPGTGIIAITQRVGEIEIETRIFAPFQAGGERDVVIVATAKNTGVGAHSVSLFTLQNLHTGGEGQANGEQISTVGDGVLETRGGDLVLHTPLGSSDRGAAPAGDSRNPWARVNGDSTIAGELVSGDDVAVGFQFNVGTLTPGQEATRGVVVSLGESSSVLTARVADFVDGRSAEQLLQAERDAWAVWHSGETIPAEATADERAVFEQSTAVLRMGQVREPGASYGQILASLPPGMWNISWPRDASYATVGLIKAGHAEEAKASLQFMIDGDAGYYAGMLGIDDYLVSAARYFGNGKEESDGATCPDGSDAGPNVELDDFGLFLWAYGEYAAKYPEDGWIDDTLPTVLAGVADPLLALIEGRRLAADSSIWERHWNTCFPNGRKHFSYSAIQAVAGLEVAAKLSGNEAYTDGARLLREGLLQTSADGGPVFFETAECPVVASAPEEICQGCGPYDASVIEIVNHGIIRPESSLAIGTLQGMQHHLRMDNTGSPGFLRNDDGTGTTNPYPWYDDQEWVVIDLRMAAAYQKVGVATENAALQQNGRVLVDWVTDLARANHDLIPELLSDGKYTHEDDEDRMRPGNDVGAEFQGAVPMCGFGPGAYILALEAMYE